MSLFNSLSPDDFDRLLKESLQTHVPKSPPPRRVWYRIRAALRASFAPFSVSERRSSCQFANVSPLSYATVNSYIWRNLI